MTTTITAVLPGFSFAVLAHAGGRGVERQGDAKGTRGSIGVKEVSHLKTLRGHLFEVV